MVSLRRGCCYCSHSYHSASQDKLSLEGGTHTLPTSAHSLLSPEQQEAGPLGCAALCFLKMATTLKEFAASQWPHPTLRCPESQCRAPSTGLSSGQV